MLPLLSPHDLAKVLGVAEQTIYNRHSNRDDLPPSIKLGRLLRFRREDVDTWLQQKLFECTSKSTPNAKQIPAVCRSYQENHQK
ncbi:helix-turn-helix domain-containing protein [Herbaspirillum sp. 1173]|uniref:helix-turn-helix transcriptional regulator n=1 Tax=Herbaspirillum sp. 1173 TaxID=2817734 RepID=UPI00286CFA59|nr:helix-turn-helix domain-containing protein [Herbaspirillum sp. 1173]